MPGVHSFPDDLMLERGTRQHSGPRPDWCDDIERLGQQHKPDLELEIPEPDD